MRKLKRQKLNAIYLMIFTATLCSMIWNVIDWQKSFFIGFLSFVVVAYLWDSRYLKFFE